MHYVIVGNGMSGIEAALALRRRDEKARISLVSSEYEHFFSRPALMYVFAGQLRLRDTEPYDRDLYERLNFERIQGRVIGLNTGTRRLRFEGDRELGYDRLLLAVGSRGRPAPWPGAEDGPGVHYFVQLEDLERLNSEARSGQRAVIIGGGLIGIEVAEVLQDRGVHVTFVIRESWYFPLALDSRESAMVAEHMRHHGVDVRLETNVGGILRGPDGRVRGVEVGGEEIPCAFVVSSIGVVPNTGFLAESDLDLSKGGAIEVDDALKTNVEQVWAAGDCANVTWADGSRRPEPLWYTARDQGRIAAASMLGDDVRYRRGTWYNSAKFFDIEYTTAGWVPVTLNWDNSPLEPQPGVRSWFQRVPGRYETQRIIVQGEDERIVGFNLLGSRWNHEVLLDWIHERRGLDYVLERMPQAQFDEEFSRRFKVYEGAQWT